MTVRRVIGVDSSTQSCKVVLCDAATGRVLGQGRADHPAGTEVNPDAWWEALQEASAGLLEQSDAISVAGQQHGMVALDESGSVVRDALLWNDLRSAPDADDLVAELGPAEWAAGTGSVPGASFTVSKLRWLARCEPENAARTAQVLLPHDWLTWRLSGATEPPTTDRGDASGTGYFSAADGAYRLDLAERALGHRPLVPRVAPPAAAVGTVAASVIAATSPAAASVEARRIVIGPGTGDNMAAALGLGTGPGDVVLSLGTSGTVFGVADRPTADPTGAVAGFADAAGGFLPLVCTLNAARVLTATAAMLGVDLADLDALALQAPAGSGGLTLLPYLDGERTPNLPGATGSLFGLTRAAMTPANIARAAVEGMLCGLADGLDALTATGFHAGRLLIIGGAAASRAVQASVASLFGLPVSVPAPAEYVAIGAARQAAGAMGMAAEELASWQVPSTHLPQATAAELAIGREVRQRYAAARTATHGM